MREGWGLAGFCVRVEEGVDRVWGAGLAGGVGCRSAGKGGELIEARGCAG